MQTRREITARSYYFDWPNWRGLASSFPRWPKVVSHLITRLFVSTFDVYYLTQICQEAALPTRAGQRSFLASATHRRDGRTAGGDDIALFGAGERLDRPQRAASLDLQQVYCGSLRARRACRCTRRPVYRRALHADDAQHFPLCRPWWNERHPRYPSPPWNPYCGVE